MSHIVSVRIDPLLSSKLQVVPNPVPQGPEVKLVIFDENQNQYRIYNTLGKVVASGNLVKGKNYLYTAKLSPGMYLVQVKNGKTMKLIVR